MREELIKIIRSTVGVASSAHAPGRIADHILASGIAVQKWIPVTERLPDKEGSYFVVTEKGAVTFARFYREHDLYDFRGTFIGHSPGGFQSNRKVSYWMPLPEPPKEIETCPTE